MKAWTENVLSGNLLQQNWAMCFLPRMGNNPPNGAVLYTLFNAPLALGMFH